MVELRDTAQISDHVLDNSLVQARGKRKEWRVTRERERWCFFFSRLLCTRLHSPEKSLQEKKLALQTNFMRPNAVF